MSDSGARSYLVVLTVDVPAGDPAPESWQWADMLPVDGAGLLGWAVDLPADPSPQLSAAVRAAARGFLSTAETWVAFASGLRRQH